MKLCSRATVLLALLVAVTIPAHAQTAFPTRPVRIVVPLAPGGSTDVLARLVASKLSEVWGQQVIVDNRGGGGTMIGTEIVARAPADGYTLLMVTSAFAVNFSLYEKLPYRFSDFVALSNVGQTPKVLAVHPSDTAKNVKELIALLRVRTG